MFRQYIFWKGTENEYFRITSSVIHNSKPTYSSTSLQLPIFPSHTMVRTRRRRIEPRPADDGPGFLDLPAELRVMTSI